MYLGPIAELSEQFLKFGPIQLRLGLGLGLGLRLGLGLGVRTDSAASKMDDSEHHPTQRQGLSEGGLSAL